MEHKYYYTKEEKPKVAYSDPQMIEISLHEIKNFLTTAFYAKIILLVGTFFCGGIVSALISKISVKPYFIVLSVALFVLGVYLEYKFTFGKFKELEKKGSSKWN